MSAKFYTKVQINDTVIKNDIIEVDLQNGLYYVEYWTNRPLQKHVLTFWADEVTYLSFENEIVTKDLSIDANL